MTVDTNVTPGTGGENDRDGRRGIRPGALAGGAILLVVGGSMLLEVTGAGPFPLRPFIGPIFLIGLGVAMTVGKDGIVCGERGRPADGGRRARARHGSGAGIWLIGIGGWLIVSQTHLYGLDFHNSWPLFIVLSGITLLVKGLQ